LERKAYWIWLSKVGGLKFLEGTGGPILQAPKLAQIQIVHTQLELSNFLKGKKQWALVFYFDFHFPSKTLTTKLEYTL